MRVRQHLGEDFGHPRQAILLDPLRRGEHAGPRGEMRRHGARELDPHRVLGCHRAVVRDRGAAAPDRVGELAALAVPDVAGRRAHQPGHAGGLAALAHVEADEGLVAAEQGVGECAGELGLAHAGRAHEEEGPHGPPGIAETRPRTPHRVGHQEEGLVLADHALPETVLDVEQAVDFVIASWACVSAR